jgi:hypothetical protein
MLHPGTEPVLPENAPLESLVLRAASMVIVCLKEHHADRVLNEGKHALLLSLLTPGQKFPSWILPILSTMDEVVVRLVSSQEKNQLPEFKHARRVALCKYIWICLTLSLHLPQGYSV